MLFRKKSNVAAPSPAPAAVSMAANGEPDLRGLGRVLWAKKTRILGVTLVAAAAAFVVVNAITPRYRSESRLLLEARENVFLRAEADKNNGDRNTHRSRSGDQPDSSSCCRAISRAKSSRKKISPIFRNSIRRWAACRCGKLFSPVRHRPQSGTCPRKSARWRPITTGSTSLRSTSRASSPSISIPPMPISPAASPTRSPRPT